MSDDLTKALAEALGKQAERHVYSCRCHGEGDPISARYSPGSVGDDEAWYDPNCVSQSVRADRRDAALVTKIAAALAPLIEARVREAQGPCTCPPWHPGTDGPEEDCAQHGRPYAYWVEYAGVLEGRISTLLWDLTGGLLSGTGYDVPTMVQAVEEHFERTVVREARADALTTAADTWTQGAWASTPRHKDRVADRMAASQYAGDWLRERAEEERQ